MTTAAEARQALIDLTAFARRELFALWQSLMGRPPREVEDILLEVLPVIGDEYGSAAAALAADWYDELRERAGAGGRYVAQPREMPDRGRWESLVRWGLEPLFTDEPDPQPALSRIDGGLQRTVADQHRLTIVENTQRDPQARGWRRVGVGDSCGFCRMLIDRGAVYTEASVTFRSHDRCNCAASPVWDDNVVRVSPEAYRQSRRYRSAEAKAADNKRAYDYIKRTYGADDAQ